MSVGAINMKIQYPRQQTITLSIIRRRAEQSTIFQFTKYEVVVAAAK